MSETTTETILNWHKQDPEQKIGFHGGRYTSPNKLLGFLIACACTFAFYAVVLFGAKSWQPTQHIAQIFLERGPTQYVTTGFFFWALALLSMKARKIKFQQKAFNLPIIPTDPSFCLNPETARTVLHQIHELVDNPMNFAVLNRMERALSNMDNMGNTADMTAILKIQAENDESQVASSYGFIQGLMWAIPVLGFIGTVLGLGQAIGAFGMTLQQDGDLAGIKESLTFVTGGLSTAFDTTLVALVMALILQLLVSLLQGNESNWLDSCNEYCSRKLAGRLRLRDH